VHTRQQGAHKRERDPKIGRTDDGSRTKYHSTPSVVYSWVPQQERSRETQE
ncbi:hypothetical protein ACRALDRAFT_1094247, partial [Sodiomyces alcalophilus JCM 7366]|uniref:uncharacterized protein n=1 Tax=Sodiomyces alcalophilus JCM 7366 TaxID=591952 RepID=UPI0039B5A995